MKQRTKRSYSLVMNCTAPVLTLMFLAGSFCWASELCYGEAEVFDKNPEVCAAALSGGSAVRAALKPSPSLMGSSDRLVKPELTSASMQTAGIAETANPGAELIEASGVYIGDEFVGAVTDGGNIEKKLSELLEGYKEEKDVINADFAVQPDIKQGLYRTETLVDGEKMTDFLTGEKRVVTEYTADSGDTPEKIAEEHGMSVEEVKTLNPDMDELEDGESVKISESVSVLPVKYVRREQEEETIELDSFRYDDDCGLVSDAISGKRINTFEVTYVDGEEIGRKLRSTETVELPGGDDDALSRESIPEAEGIFSGEFIWPVNGGSVSDPFGSDRNHKGMDIAAPEGTDIYASDGGTVLEAGWNDGGYGNFVMIDHGNGYITLYAHASAVFVEPGDNVEQGQLIAAVGTTGDSTGNHCHFEVRYGKEYLDPAKFVQLSS